ncbi:hypothetical protein S83_024409 [Arachis hypogaea]
MFSWQYMLKLNTIKTKVMFGPKNMNVIQKEIETSCSMMLMLVPLFFFAVTYLQHNKGGITLYEFTLDRELLHTLFAFELSLVLWILSKVVVLS